MSNAVVWIKIIGVPAGKEEDRFPRQEFEGLVLPSITSKGKE